MNLGGLQLLLGHPEQAIDHLTASFALAVEAGSQPDAAQALGSLAAVYEQLGDHDAADEHARKALALLEGRDDFLDELAIIVNEFPSANVSPDFLGEHDFIAPSINVETLDPELSPAEIATALVENAGLDTVMTNSFGFGGTNATLILQKPD